VRFRPIRANSLGVTVSSEAAIRTPTASMADPENSVNFTLISIWLLRKGRRWNAFSPLAAVILIVSFTVSPGLLFSRNICNSGTGRCKSILVVGSRDKSRGRARVETGRGRCVSIFLDKNRRYIGKFQSKRPDEKDATAAAPLWRAVCGRAPVSPSSSQLNMTCSSARGHM
jgi:hypothetical protein